jgi:hypothetical protein
VDVAPGEVRLAHGTSLLGRVRLLGVERVAGEPSAALAAAARHRPAMLCALPAAAAAHRFLVMPFGDRRRLARTVPMELRGQVAAETEDAAVAFGILGPTAGGTAVLAALARRADLAAHLASLARAGLAPARVELAPLPAWRLLSPAPGEEALVVADGARSALSLRRGGRVAALRALGTTAGEPTTFAAEVRWSLSALGGAPARLVLAGADATPPLAQALAAATGVRVVPLAEAASARLPRGAPLAACAVAAGLVLGAAGAPSLAFDTGTAPAAPLRRAGALAAAAAVLAVADLGLARHELARRDAALAAAVRAEAGAALPGARLAAPRAELEAALAERTRGRPRHGAGGGLALLRELSTRVPSSLRLDLDELVIDGEELRLHGRTESFDAVDGLRRALAASPLLADVRADETRTTVDGRRVEFRLRAARRPAGGTAS